MDDENFQQKAFAFKIANTKKRVKCQSGGAFTAMAESLIKAGWIVYGVSFEKPFAVYKRITSSQRLAILSGSKYVQAKLSCISDLEKDLLEDRHVLFSGTPCYCSAIISYCKAKKISTCNLLTIEFLCHGVPSPKLFKYYLEYTEKKLNFQSDSFIFRDKNINGWGGYYSSLKKGKNIIKTSENWMNIFRSDRYFRPSCYNCKYTSWNRLADITISDFWNIEKTHKTFGDINGISMILFNNYKSFHFYQYFKSKGDCISVKLEAIDQLPLNTPTSYRNDGVNINWIDNCFEKNAEKILEHYSKKYISIWHGIPFTLDLEFWKEHLKYKIKGNSFLINLRKN